MSSTSIRMPRRWISKEMERKKKKKKERSVEKSAPHLHMKKIQMTDTNNIWILSSILNTSPSRVAVTFVWTKTCWKRTRRGLCSMFYSLNIIILPLLLFVCRNFFVFFVLKCHVKAVYVHLCMRTTRCQKNRMLDALVFFISFVGEMLAFLTNNMVSKKTSFSHKNHFQDHHQLFCVLNNTTYSLNFICFLQIFALYFNWLLIVPIMYQFHKVTILISVSIYFRKCFFFSFTPINTHKYIHNLIISSFCYLTTQSKLRKVSLKS